MSSRSIKDAVKTLQQVFSAPKVPPSLPSEARRMLQQFIDEYQESKASEKDATNANEQIKNLWEKYVGSSPAKLGAFTGVLRELRIAIAGRQDVLDWWQLVLRPVITSNTHKKAVYDDAHEFLVHVMTYETDAVNSAERFALSSRLSKELFSLYISRSRVVDAVNREADIADHQQIASRAEGILIAFGKKHPSDFCQAIDELIQTAATRVQALTLLGSFLKHQIPHLYLVINTPLVESLLKCLMNDTSTTVLSVALSTLIMILPHIPGSLRPHLPRLFLVYSRLLCWEKFSPLSTEAQKNLVTDDRLPVESAGNSPIRDVGIDPRWEKVHPQDGVIEATTPEVKTYFTFMYGLYPLNFMSYIRKPRKYLKALDFPGADDFDLDQTVIRARTEQFRDLHKLHPNFYYFTIEEELEDPKWIKTDPSDVVAECHALVLRSKAATSPGAPPTRKLPDLPSLAFGNGTPVSGSGRTSPTHSVASFKSSANNSSWRLPLPEPGMPINLDSPVSPLGVTASGEEKQFPRELKPENNRDSHIVSPIDDVQMPFGMPKSRDGAESNLQHLQRQITLLTNELNFEKWHKAQYSQHISQLARKNVKDATTEAETLNLINANRALKAQVEQIQAAREASLKDSALTRKQAGNLENHMMDRFRTMKKDQESWMADSAELRRLRDEISQYRDLLVACEARELSKTHELEILQRDVEQFQIVRDQLKDATKRLHEYEYRDFEFGRAKREAEILQKEKNTLQMKLQQREQEADRQQKNFRERIAELEGRQASQDSFSIRSPHPSSSDSRMYAQQEAEANNKLSQLKKAYSRLLERHTDLELECQSLRSQLEMYQGHSEVRTPQTTSVPENLFDFGVPDRRQAPDAMSVGYRGGDSAYDSYGEYNAAPEPPLTSGSASDPSGRRYGLANSDGFSRAGTVSSRNSTQLVTYNQTAPLEELKQSMTMRSDSTTETARERKTATKIQPQSEIRVYGRGGAQNIKLKSKDKKEKDPDKPKTGGFRGLRNIM